MKHIWKTVLVSLLLFGHTASAEEANSLLACEEATEFLSPMRYLRALTFDLAGRAPSEEEISTVSSAGEVPEALIDGLLADRQFAEQAARFHRSFLWNNLSTVRLVNANFRLQRASGQLYWRRNPARVYRGDNIPCLDQPAQFDQDGNIMPISGTQEGYVLVRPYWLPEGETIKVCAYDAQTQMESSSGVICNTRGGANQASCGCGPNLRWCSFGSGERAITDAMSESMEQFILSVFERNEPYSTLFDSRRAFINGPLSFFYQNWLDIAAGIAYRPLAINPEQTPQLDFLNEEWVEYTLPETHAGLLTHPAFLLRFQTNRARANRFYDAFLCNGFQAPDSGLPVADDGNALNPNLQERTGCEYCHARLEPAAAHWGRWTEQGIGFLDEDRFPATREDCLRCALTNQGCSAECRNFYLTNQLSPEEQPYLGQLNAYVFLKETDEEHIERGPRRLAYTEIEKNQLPACIAKRTAEWLIGRSLENDEYDWRDGIAKTFVWSDLNYRALVKAIVTSDVYRRVK